MEGSPQYDVIVVGAGAAGAVLAARLAEGGLRILVLEAGGDPLTERPGDGGRSLDRDCRVPAWHPFASEHPGLKHDVWVRHYADSDRQARDWRYRPEHDGVLYPRARGLGGCASHHAMIIVKPNDQDWNHIAEVTGDPTWRASAMERYWQRIERCRYRWFPWRWMAWLTGWNPTGHGWWGWLTTERSLPLRVLRDRPLRMQILRSMGAAADACPGHAFDWEATRLDPNARRLWNPHASGVRVTPMGTRRHARHGARERLLDVARRHPSRIEIRLHAEVRRVEVADGRARAVVFAEAGREVRAEARHEIVLCGGVFASPQLLMLSGIGPAAHLDAHGIRVVRDLPGVGANLQDRYEIGVVNRMKQPWAALRGINYSPTDRAFKLWKLLRMGNYTSNGLLYSVELKSRPELRVPDLFCFAIIADFRGYYPGYSERIRARDYLTWAVLKAYTHNRAGTVRLRSADPAVPADIQFRYFDEGSPGGAEDLDAVVTGIRFVRKIADAMDDLTAAEEEPGRSRETDDALRSYVRDNAWGHHACGTCAMMPEDRGGVVDSRFRVHGIAGLRVADASVFPRIPGYFLVAPVHMIGERAADTILDDIRAMSGATHTGGRTEWPAT
ncbi:MAG: GMC family oxidoreductase [Rhodobacteraceae bacterium]|nr:GMC family oxidoreductase [Paracoccaceae bacterium]